MEGVVVHLVTVVDVAQKVQEVVLVDVLSVEELQSSEDFEHEGFK